MASEFKTLQEAIIYFSNADNCLQYVVSRRWPNGVTCPTCGSADIRFLANQQRWECKEKHPRKQFSVKVGTIFEDSPISLQKWLPAAWLISSNRNGISSWELHRALGVTQKTAWFMLQRLRLAMQDEHSGGKLGGEVEVDETYIGGKARNMHKSRKRRVQQAGGRNAGGKTTVMGMLERGKTVRFAVIEDRTKATMQPIVRQHVERGAQLFSDEWGAYWRMDAEYQHEVVNHLETYVDGNVHTNGIENFWSLLKRGINGTYVSVEPFHLFRYVDEEAFRFNNRLPMTDADRFSYLIRKVVGKRLTYAALTGKTEEQTSEEVPF
jgi:transposase-like protein